jgi:pimeloyl-ACP methyl ester carboxylesterase
MKPSKPSASLALPILLSLSACASHQAVQREGTAMTAAKPAALQGSCEALQAKLVNLPKTKIAAVKAVAAGELKMGAEPVAAHCVVTGAVNERVSAVDGKAYAIGFEMRLPLAWNGRFWYQANGGIDGSVVQAMGALGGGPITSALHQGFAVVSSDAGHDNRVTRGPGFGFDPQARLDYGYQTVGTLTPISKQMVALAYGKAPDRSYIGGCSNGGRHALVAAARYPEMFDGYLAGAPGYRLPLAAVANIFGAQQYKQVATDPKNLGSAFTVAERQTVVNALLAKCDALDGAPDGLIQDVQACQAAFSLARDVPTCKADSARDGSCLSAAQKQAIAPIFSGATTKAGVPFYAPFPYDASLATEDVTQWEFNAPINLDSGAVGFIFATPPHAASGFNGAEFALNGDIDAMLASVQASNASYTESAMAFMTPPANTALTSLSARGAKVLMYHGVSDAIFSVHDTEQWLKAAGSEAQHAARLFRVPGMTHCRGGASTDQFDAITPLVNWVEKGIAPDSIIATARGAGNAGGVNKELPANWSANRSRPLCAYPKVARYKGTGDMEAASSFACQ